MAAAWTLTLTVPAELSDAASGLMWMAGAQGVREHWAELDLSIRDDGDPVLEGGHPEDVAPPIPEPAEGGAVLLTATWGSEEEARSARDFLDNRLPGHSLEGPTGVPEEDWQKVWKEGFAPFDVGRRLHIVPAWMESEAPADRVSIHIDPGMAFGTGTHETTRLMLEALEDVVREGSSVLDLGSGTGLLAFAATRLGAGRVLGLEPDPMALDNARQNRARNGLENSVELTLGDCASAVGEWDLVLANILAPVLIRDARSIAARVAAGGTLLVSGLLRQSEEAVAAAFAAEGMDVANRRHDGDWCLLELGRGAEHG